MKKNIKIEGKTIAALVIAAVVLTGGVFVFSRTASALIQAVEQFDGGGTGIYDPEPNPNPITTPIPTGNSSWPSAGTSKIMSTCSNGLVVTRSASCSGTTLIVSDYYSAWTSPAFEDCVYYNCTSQEDCTNANATQSCTWVNEVFHPAHTNPVGSEANSSQCPLPCTSAANDCGVTNTGFVVNGVCNASKPANPTPIPCTSSANICGDTALGTKACPNSACSAIKPADPAPIACTSAGNNCKETNGGFKTCPTSACSATKPADKPLPSCTSAANICGQTKSGTTQCDGTCDAVKPADPAPIDCVSAANVCGQTNPGTKVCPTSACSATKPADPAPIECESAANICGMKNPGFKTCPTSACSAIKPLDSLCDCGGNPPANFRAACTSAPNVCGVSKQGTIACDGSCSPKSPNPTDYGRPCSAPANICGTASTGTMICSAMGTNNLKCSVSTTPNPEPLPCTSAANGCGQTSPGTRACPTSTCNAVVPPLPQPIPCSSAPNACGQVNTGLKVCPTSACSASTPTVVPIPCTSAANICGMTNTSVKNCASDACPAAKPSDSLCNCGGNPPANFGKTCTTAANICGQTYTRTIQCDGTCGAKPLDALCPIPCTSAPNSCGQTTSGVSVSGICNAVTPPNPLPIPCTTEPNTCGMTQTGTKACSYSSCLPKVPDSSCPLVDCTSTPNACGQTGTGKIVGGVCNAVTPPNPKIYVDTGSCVAPPIVDGSCSPTAINGCLSGSIFSDRADTGVSNLWTCKGLNGGKDALCSLAKSPAIKPTVTINPVSNNLLAGGTTSFTWTATNASWCVKYVNNSLVGSVSNSSGTVNSLPLFTTTTYDIQCGNDNGNPPAVAQGTHVANVAALATPVITINPPVSNITAGGQATFAITVTNSTRCRIFEDGKPGRPILAVDTFTTGGLFKDTPYEVSCINEFGPGPIYPTAVGKHNVFVASIPPGPPILKVLERPVYTDTPFNENNAQKLTITNTGDQVLVGDVSIKSDQSNVFSIVDSNRHFELSKGVVKTFYVNFGPKRTGSKKNALIQKAKNLASSVFALVTPIRIRSDAAVTIKVNPPAISQDVPINGTGVDVISGDDVFNVGDAPKGLSRTYNYRVDNNSELPVVACLKLNTGSVFKLGTQTTVDRSIGTRAYELFNIVFSPTAIAPFADTLTIGIRQLDGSCKSIYDVSVIGNGVKPISDFKER